MPEEGQPHHRLSEIEKRLVAMVALLESPAPLTSHREHATRLAELEQWLSENAPAVRLALHQARSSPETPARKEPEGTRPDRRGAE